MNKRRKRILLVLSPVIVSLILTLAGLIFDYVPLISWGGYILWFILFVLFMFSDRLVLWVKAIRENTLSLKYFAGDQKLDQSVKLEIAKALSDLPVGAALALRALFLTLSFWVVDFYFSLCDGGIMALFGTVPQTIGSTLLTATVTLFEIGRGKSLREQGVPTKLLSIVGAFSFYRSFAILFIGGGYGAESFRTMKGILSNPLWFFDNPLRIGVIHFSDSMGLVFFLIIFGLFPFLYFLTSKDLLSRPMTEDNVDSKNFAYALAVFSCWMMSVPVVYFFALVSHS